MRVGPLGGVSIRRWQLFGAHSRPATAAEEAAFVAALRAHRATRHTRDDLTMLLGALRCGLGLAPVLELLPGAAPGALRGAYEALEARRAAAVGAWHAIVADPESLVVHAETAATLLPVPVARLCRLGDQAPPEVLAQIARRLAGQVEAAGTAALALERELAAARDAAGAVAIGFRLYDPETPGLWSSRFFLAPRVGALVPLRVQALLGERR